MHLSIVIPAYNEERRIPATLKTVRDYLAHTGFESEVLVVNDGSTDKTSDVIAAARNSMPYLRELRYAHNRGKGYATQFGMRAAKGALRLFMDADNATSIEQLDTLLPFAKEYPVVISSRRLPQSRVLSVESRTRELLSRCFHGLARLLLPLGVTDTQNGFKLFTGPAAEALFAQLTTYGWAFDIEILALARKDGLRIKEVPVYWRNGGHSRLTFGAMLRMGYELFRIAWKYRS